MTLRPLLRAALLASVLVAVSGCGDTLPNGGEPDAGPSGTPPDGGPPPPGPDTDGDGLGDALEDANGNGRRDDGETDAHSRDTDCDGLADGPGVDGVRGEDQNANGRTDSGETDPRRPDTDGDGLTDGVELGVMAAVEPTRCASTPVDAHPASVTNPTRLDSDGDGIADGVEDTNQDGMVDPGELDPRNGADGTGPAAEVCSADRLRPVAFRTLGEPDLQVALPAAPRFAEIQLLTVGGAKVGLMGYDAATGVAFLVYRTAPTQATAAEEEKVLRTRLEAVGALGNVLPQTFRTWDGYDALKAQYDQTGGVGLKVRANALAGALLGTSVEGLSTATDVTVSGDFRLQAQYVRRSDQSLVVLVALTSLAGFDGTPLFTVNDLSGGSALAQFADTTAVQCEPFTPGRAKVDYLFVVDDSGSMADFQDALGSAATAMAQQLGNSTLDWRVALVTSSYHVTGYDNSGRLRGFTRDLGVFKSWLTKHPSCSDSSNQCGGGEVCRAVTTGWVGICGKSEEGILGAARKATDDLTPGTALEQAGKVRADATLVVVLLGDADDQSTGYLSTGSCGTSGTGCVSASEFSQFFLATGTTATTKNKTGRPITVHGILCPEGESCGETNFVPQRHGAVVTSTGGIQGAILVPDDATGELARASIRNAMAGIINDSIASGGYRLSDGKAPIGTSLKVAMDVVENPGTGADQCDATNIPRSRVNGFDFSGTGQTLSFYGACRPTAQTRQAAVSYRYWVDARTDPDGRTPCVDDPRFDATQADFCQGHFACEADACICVPPPGGCPTGQSFNGDAAVCACVPELG